MMASDIISRIDAKTKGLSRYFTGEPCKHGHIAVRRTVNGVCVECDRDIEKRYRENNRDKHRVKWRKASLAARKRDPDKHRAHDKKWRDANPDKVANKRKNWRALNPDKVASQDKRRRERDPEKFRIKNKLYKTANAERLSPIALERTKRWRVDNPDKTRKNGARASQHRRARLLSASGSYTEEQIQALLEKQNWICATPRCGACLRNKRELDHIIALVRGGSNDISNLQWLCVPCNRRKQDKSPEEWAIICARIFPTTKDTVCQTT